MKYKVPFIKKFSDKKGNYYIYDVNTNKVVKVNNLVKDVIDLIYSYSKEDIIDKAADHYDPNSIEHAVDEINYYVNNQGLFLPNRPDKIDFGLRGNEIREKLAREVKSITLNITNNCNLACKYCPYCDDNAYSEIRPKKDMDEEVALTAVDFFFKHNERIRNEGMLISFYGGEPLLNMGVIEACVEYVKNKYKKYHNKVHFVINTNGTLLNDEVVSYLMDNKILLHISIDGPEDVHNANRLSKMEQEVMKL